MSIDMNTYGREIRKAIDEVVSESGNDWCIFGYEGKTYTLKVVAEGDAGIEEMVDEFHGSKIMYGYCKVKEPNTGLPKFVFINWQGEGAPERMKFACGSHSTEVQRVCRTAHVTVNARDESDVDPKDIISRVVKASGSQHSVLKSSNNAPPIEPVGGAQGGSVYKKVNPTAEILNRERDAYWQKIEAEERRQKVEEENRRRQEKERQERELRERDRREAENRERRTSERAQQIAQQRSHERQVEMRVERRQSEQEAMEDVAMQESERRQRSESLKNERQAELASLIAQRNAAGMAPSQKIGTNYRKVDPRQEISSVKRDEYWEKMEEEEAKRRDEEKRRRAEEMSEIERSRRRREEEDAKRREVSERERATAIAQQRQAERERAAFEKQSKEAQARAIHQEAIADEQERQSRSERLRRERQEEAARLIAQRGGTESTNSARNFFQRQNSGSMEQQPPPKREPPKMALSAATPFRAPEQSPAPLPSVAPVSAPVTSPGSATGQYQQHVETSGWSDEEEVAPVQKNYEPEPQPVQPSGDYQPDAYDDHGFCAEAIYDYEATEDDEISFNPGDIIMRIDKIDDGWWMGETSHGHRGLFPANYVRAL